LLFFSLLIDAFLDEKCRCQMRKTQNATIRRGIYEYDKGETQEEFSEAQMKPAALARSQIVVVVVVIGTTLG
jgi:hypothetical protein